MQAFYYLILAQPGPVGTVIDFYLLQPIYLSFSPKYDSNTFVLRDRLGGGNFGITYEAVRRRSALPLPLL